MITGRVGQTFTFAAVNDDPSGAADPNAIDSWEETDASGAPLSSGFIGPLTPVSGTNTATAAELAAGSGFVVATATDPDGNKVASQPFAWSVLAATDTSVVTVSGTSA